MGTAVPSELALLETSTRAHAASPMLTCFLVSTVVCEIVLPSPLPPSFTGRLARVLYVVTVAFRRTDSAELTTMNVAFRVRAPVVAIDLSLRTVVLTAFRLVAWAATM